MTDPRDMYDWSAEAAQTPDGSEAAGPQPEWWETPAGAVILLVTMLVLAAVGVGHSVRTGDPMAAGLGLIGAGIALSLYVSVAREYRRRPRRSVPRGITFPHPADPERRR